MAPCISCSYYYYYRTGDTDLALDRSLCCVYSRIVVNLSGESPGVPREYHRRTAERGAESGRDLDAEGQLQHKETAPRRCLRG